MKYLLGIKHLLQEQGKENTTIQNQIKRDDKSRLQRTRSSVPRILTLTTRDINEIIGYKDMLFALYEVYGKQNNLKFDMNVLNKYQFNNILFE